MKSGPGISQHSAAVRVSPARIVLSPVLKLNPMAAGIRAACIPAGLIFALGSTTTLAGPEGGQVVGGQGSISKPDTNTTNIHQQSHNMAIDWNSYNLNKNETVNYRQPSSTAHALNRIYDHNPSQIFGTINANGRVTLVNPNGIFFGPSASVNVNSLIASGHDISVEDFMNGRLNFKLPDGQSAGAVINQGLLQAATGGSINLIGGSVRNEGLIIASAGQVNLAAGDQVTMDFDGDGLVRFAIDKEVLQNAEGVDSAISNTGEIIADGGTVILSGRAAQDVFSHVVNNEGVVRAGRIENQGGKIVLAGSGGSQSSVINTGTLDASAGDATSDGGSVEVTGDTIEQQGVIKADSTGGDGGTIKTVAEDTNIVSGDAIMSATSVPSPSEGEGQDGGENTSGGKGGSVHVLGDKVALADMASIDVSGEIGGGTVLFGGDFQGSNPDIQNASRAFIGSGTTIRADGGSSGDGGKVIAWADEVTRYYGDISVQGGTESGDGGFVEVSGKDYLDFNGTVDMSAANGSAGQLLLDPTTLNIIDENSVGTLDGTNCGGPCTVNFADGGATESVSVAAIEAINSGTITLQAAQTININDLTLNASNGEINLQSDVSLVLQTRNDNASGDGEGGIVFANTANSIIAQGTGSITLEAGTSGTDGGSLTTIGNLQTDTGRILLRAADAGGGGTGAGDIDIDGTITTNGGDFIAQASGNITLDGTTSTSGGNVHLEANSRGVGNNGAGGADDDTGADSTLTINSDISSSGGNITLIGEDDVIVASVDAGAGNINVAELGGSLNGAFDVGDTADLEQAEIDNLTTTGTLTLGYAATAGTDGLGTGTENVIASTLSVTAGGAINIPAAGGSSVVLNAQNGITLNNSLTVDSTLTVNADNQDGSGTADGTGTFTILDTFALDTTDNTLNINAADINLNTSGAIDSGTANTTITATNDRAIALGVTTAASDLELVNAEFDSITAANLLFETTGTGTITSNATTAVASNGDVTLRTAGTGTISFVTGTSTFANAVTLDSTGTITLGADITTDGGDISVLNATDIDLAANVSLTTESGDGDVAAGDILLPAAADIDSNTAAGEFGLTINTTSTAGDGNVTLGRVGFNQALGFLDVTANSGTITLGSGSITTTAAGTGDGRVVFGSNTVLTANTAISTTGGLADFSDTIFSSDGSGPWTLDIDTTTGDATDEGDVLFAGADNAGGNYLSTLTITADESNGAAGDLTFIDDADAAVDITLDDADFIFTGGDSIVSDSVSIDTNPDDAATSGALNFGSSNIYASTTGLDFSVDATGATNGNVTLGLVDNNAGGNSYLRNFTIIGNQVSVESVTVAGSIDVTGSTAVNLGGSTYQSTTTGGTIDFTGAVDLTGTGAVAVQTAGGAGDDITVTGTIEDTGSDSDLTLNAGASGNISITGATGATNALSSFTMTNAAQADLNSVRTTGSIDVTATDILLAGSNYQSTTTGGTIDFTGAVDLTGTGAVAVQTAGGAGDDITVTGTIEDTGSDSDLTLNAGAGGDISITGATGGTNALSSFTVSNAAIANLNSITTGAGGIDVTGTAINLQGTDYITAAGDVIFSGAVMLETNVAVDTGGTTGDITFGSTLNATTAFTETLDLTAGTGNIAFNGITGGTNELGTVTINSAGTVDVNADFSIASLAANAGGGAPTIASFDSSGTTISTTNDVDVSSGDILVATTGNLTTGTVSAAGAVSAQGGNVSLRSTTGDLSVGAIDTSGGDGDAVLLVLDPDPGENAGTIDLTADTGGITLNANLAATGGDADGTLLANGGNGGAVTIDGAVTLATDIQIDTRGGSPIFGGSQGTDGNVTLTGSVASATPFASGLTVNASKNASSTSTVDISGSTLTDLDHIRILAGSGGISLGDMTTGDGAANPMNANTAIDITSEGDITLVGDLDTTGDPSTNAGGISLTGTGNLVLADPDGTVAINTDAGGTDASITFDMPIEPTTAETEGLQLTAGGADVTFNALVGATNRTGDIDIVSANNVNLNEDINATSFSQQAGAGTTTLASTKTLNTNNQIGATGVGISISAATLDLEADTSLVADNFNIELFVDDLLTGSNVTITANGGAGNVTLAPNTLTNTIEICDSGDVACVNGATFDSSYDIAGLSTINAASFTIGRTAHTGNITIQQVSPTFDLDVTNGGTGSITVNGAYAGSGFDLVLTSGSDGVTDGTAGTGGNAITVDTLALVSSGDIDVTSVTPQIAAETTGGNIFIENTGAVNIADLTVATGLDASGTVSLINTADITLGAAVTAGTTVNLEATAGSINDTQDDLVTDITGTAVTLTAQDEIGGNSPAGATTDTRGAIEISSSGLDVSVTTAGNVVLTDVGGTELTDIDTVSGVVDILSDADLTVGDVDATGAVSIATTGGSINDAAADIVTDLSGSSIDLDATTGIGNTAALELSSASISADTTNGNIDLDNSAGAATTVSSLGTGTGTINFDQTGNQTLDITSATTTVGSITINNTGADLTLTTVTAGGAGSDITASTITSGNIIVDTNVSATDQLSLTSAGTITDNTTATTSAGGNASFSGTTITIGDSGTDSFNAGTLTFNSGGAVVIAEDSDTDIAGSNTADSLDLDSTGAIDDAGASDITVTNLADVAGTSITLGSGGTFDAGTLTFNSGGAVVIAEDSATVIAGTNTADSLSLTSSGSITDDGTGEVAVTTTTVLDAGGDIILDDIDNDFTGAVTVNNGNAVTLADANSLTIAGITATGAVTLNIDRGTDDAATLLFTGTVTGTSVTADGQGTNDTLAAHDVVNTFTIAGGDAGTLSSAGSTNIAYTDFANLTGGTDTDSFEFNNGVTQSGIIDGGDGSDTYDLSNYSTNVSLTLTALGGTDGFDGTGTGIGVEFQNINTITAGSGSTNSLTGADLAATWEFNGSQDGTYTTGGETLTWNDFHDLSGGSAIDIFNVDENHTGDLAGGADNDVFNFASTTFESLTGNASGDADDDTFNFGTPTGTPPGTDNYTISGLLDGGTGSNTLDYSGSALVQELTVTGVGSAGVGQQGTTTGQGGDPDLLGGAIGSPDFDNISILVGNGQGTLIGSNADTYWKITDENEGVFGSTLNAILTDTGVTAFTNFSILGGNQQDVFMIDAGGFLTGNVDGGLGNNIALGSTGTDTFDITGSTTVDVTVAGNLTTFLNIDDIDGGFSDGVTTFPDTGNDTFNIDNNWAGDIGGGGGNDEFIFAPGVTVAGNIRGDAGTDTLDWANFNAGQGFDANVSVTLTGLGTNDGFAGNTASGGIGGSFDDIDELLADSGQTNSLTGANLASDWGITGTDVGTYTVGANSLDWNSFEDLTGGTADDTFAFTTGNITGDINGGAHGTADTLDYSGSAVAPITVNLQTATASLIGGNFSNIEDLVGTGDANDELIGANNTNNWTVDGADTGNVDGFTFDAIANLTGGTVTDNFSLSGTGDVSGTIDGNGGNNTLTGRNAATTWNITATDAGDTTHVNAFTDIQNLTGGTADDTFVFTTGNITGNVNGGAHGTADTLDYSGATGPITVNLQTGTASLIGSNFSNIEDLVGTGHANDTLIGANNTNAWTIDAADSGNVDGFTFDAIARLTGGTVADTFTFVTGGSITTLLNGAGGTDEIIGPNTATTFNMNANGGGNLTGGTTVTYTSVENLTGGTANDQFNVTAVHSGRVRGGDGDDTVTWTGAGRINGLVDGQGNTGVGDTLNVSGATGTITLTLGSSFVNIENLAGSNDTLVGNNSGNSTWDLTSGSDGTLNTTAFNGFNTVRSGTGGTNTFTANGSYNGTVNLTGTRNFWNYSAGNTLTNGNVTGTGSLTIGTPATGAGGDITVGAGGLVLPNLTALTGPLFIGGVVDPATTPLNNQSVTVNTDILNVNDVITTGGDIVLLAGQINLNTNTMNVGGDMNFVATGTSCASCGPINGGTGDGNIYANQPITVNADNGTIIAAGGIQQSDNLTLDFGGGNLQLAVSQAQEDTSKPNELSDAFGIELTNETFSFINILGLDVIASVVSFFNPALQLFALEDISFIDTGLFEQDLSLFGVIGEGIALALAQCEEIEGCAPNVTPEELDTLIKGLEARAEELQKRIDETADPATREKLEQLLADYQAELQEFLGYKEQLTAFLTGPSEGDDLGDDLGEDFIPGEEELPEGEGEPGAAPFAGQIDSVDTLARMLETIQARVEFLQSLIGDAARRAELGARTGIELTEEALNRIIENTRKEADFIESLMQKLIEDSQSRSGDMFSADAGGPPTMLPSVGYNADDLLLRSGHLPMDMRWF